MGPHSAWGQTFVGIYSNRAVPSCGSSPQNMNHQFLRIRRWIKDRDVSHQTDQPGTKARSHTDHPIAYPEAGGRVGERLVRTVQRKREASSLGEAHHRHARRHFPAEGDLAGRVERPGSSLNRDRVGTCREKARDLQVHLEARREAIHRRRATWRFAPADLH